MPHIKPVPIYFEANTSFVRKIITTGLFLTVIGFFLPISNKAGNNIFYGLVLLPFLASLFTKERYNYSWGKLTPYFLLLVATMGILALPDSPVKAIKYSIYLLVFWTVISTLTSQKNLDTDTLAIWLMTISFIFCLTLLFTHFIVDEQPLSSRPNYWNTWRSGNPILACSLLVCFTVTGIAALPQHLRLRIGTIAILASLIMQSLFQTRSGIAGLLGVAVFTTLAFAAHSKKISHTLFISLSIFIISLAIFYQLNVFETLIARGGSYRFELYTISLSEYLGCNIFAGCGYDYNIQSTLKDGAPIAHPHSIYMSLLLYFGPISLLGLFALLLRALQLNLKDTSPWFYGVVASSAFFMVDGSKILSNPNIIWICLILPLAIIDGQSRIQKNEPLFFKR